MKQIDGWNARLEIASRILAQAPNPYADLSRGLALGVADKLIAAERESRPKCEHKRVRPPIEPDPGFKVLGPNFATCLDCGDDLP